MKAPAHRRRAYLSWPIVAVLIASDLAKDMAGVPLLRGVSFRLERRDRLTLSGRNGSGKTTLLRMLAGETSVDGGELNLAKDVRVALHDQRPPRERDLSLRDYVLGGCKDLLALEERLAELEHAMAEGDTVAAARSSAYATAQARLEHAGGYNWREGVNATLHGLGFRDEHLDRTLETFSGGELTRASLARALAGDPDLLLLDEPTNHLDIESLEWLEAHLQTLDAAVVLVAHDRWFLEAVGTVGARARGRPRALLQGHLARLAQGAGGARAGARAARSRSRRPRSPGSSASSPASARAPARARRSRAQKKLDKMDRITRDPRDGKALGFAFKPPERSGRVIFEVEDGTLKIGERTLLDHFELWLERGEHVSLIGPNGTGKTTLIHTLTGEHELAGGQAAARAQRQARAALPARRRARAPRARAPCSRPRSARPGSSPARRARCSGASCSPARRPRSRSTGSPAASGGGCRWRSSSTPAPTCSCSTSPPTTSTSRAARRSSPRCRRSPARCC